jgi:hypothetical protein
MCGKCTQLSSGQEVHALSQPLTVSTGTTEVVVSTPLCFTSNQDSMHDWRKEGSGH